MITIIIDTNEHVSVQIGHLACTHISLSALKTLNDPKLYAGESTGEMVPKPSCSTSPTLSPTIRSCHSCPLSFFTQKMAILTRFFQPTKRKSYQNCHFFFKMVTRDGNMGWFCQFLQL